MRNYFISLGPTNILDDDLGFREAATLEGFDFHLVQQPPNSPNMNVLDLGFFRSI